ncbi:hypothetical protein M422DRAFT_139441, partial [Sphaerobolus stellatus SS14]
VQLLANITLKDLQQCVERVPSNKALQTSRDNAATHFDWNALHQPGQSLVKLIDKPGVPLIVIHGATGAITAFMPLQGHFTTPLWAFQMTPDTPTDSLLEIATFYFLQIKEKRPKGPYRLAGYSACTLLAMEVARLFEANGDEIKQLIFLDHFPTLFASDYFGITDQNITAGSSGCELFTSMLKIMIDCYLRDNTTMRQKMGKEIAAAHNGLETRQAVQEHYRGFQNTFNVSIKYLWDL